MTSPPAASISPAVARQRGGGRSSQALAGGAHQGDSRHARPEGRAYWCASVQRLLPVEIRVGVVQPVLPDRREEIQLERVVEGFGLVLDPRRDVQDLAFANG